MMGRYLYSGNWKDILIVFIKNQILYFKIICLNQIIYLKIHLDRGGNNILLWELRSLSEFRQTDTPPHIHGRETCREGGHDDDAVVITVMT